jgi:hypothetical protein
MQEDRLLGALKNRGLSTGKRGRGSGANMPVAGAAAPCCL